MHYLEQLKFGDCFEYKMDKFIVTQDYDSNNRYKCINLIDGNSRWFNTNSIIKQIEIYTLDDENNICPINPRKREIS